MKRCYKCGMVRPTTEYYKARTNVDGTSNKCKDCTKTGARERREALTNTDPSFIVSERLRGREKQKRLYSGRKVFDGEDRPAARKRFKVKYPEKQAAKVSCDKLPTIPGCHRHHWSYNEAHYRDFIVLDELFHAKLHRFIIYDPKEKKYRTTENTLLETREMHEQYIKIVKEIF